MYTLVTTAFQVIYILLWARIIFSWVPQLLPYHPIRKVVYQATEPLLAPIRGIMPSAGGVDFSPLILFFGLSFLQRAILSALI